MFLPTFSFQPKPNSTKNGLSVQECLMGKSGEEGQGQGGKEMKVSGPLIEHKSPKVCTGRKTRDIPLMWG